MPGTDYFDSGGMRHVIGSLPGFGTRGGGFGAPFLPPELGVPAPVLPPGIARRRRPRRQARFPVQPFQAQFGAPPPYPLF